MRLTEKVLVGIMPSITGTPRFYISVSFISNITEVDTKAQNRYFESKMTEPPRLLLINPSNRQPVLTFRKHCKCSSQIPGQFTTHVGGSR